MRRRNVCSVSRPTEGLTAGHQLIFDIRSFQLSTAGAPQAEVEFSAKILGDSGKIVGAKIFHAAVPATAADAPTAAAALNDAFGKTAVELVVWASGLI